MYTFGDGLHLHEYLPSVTLWLAWCHKAVTTLLAKASIEAIVFHHWVQTLWWRTEYRVYLTVYIQLWHLLSYSHLNITVWTDDFCRATLRNCKRPCTHKAKAMWKRWTRYACFSSCVMRFVMATIFLLVCLTYWQYQVYNSIQDYVAMYCQ